STRKAAADRRPTSRSTTTTAATTAYGSSQPRGGPATAPPRRRQALDARVRSTSSTWSTWLPPPARRAPLTPLRRAYPARPTTPAQGRHPAPAAARVRYGPPAWVRWPRWTTRDIAQEAVPGTSRPPGQSERLGACAPSSPVVPG